jgi:hypothetical protein
MGDIGLPLSQLHARDLRNREDIVGMLRHLGSICGKAASENFVDAFMADLPVIESSIPASGLEITTWRQGRVICLSIRNIGSRVLNLIDAELLIPTTLGPTLQPFSPLREQAFGRESDVELSGYRLTTMPYTLPHLGLDPLRSSLSPAMGEVPLIPLHVAFGREPRGDENKLPIRYRVSTKEQDFGPFVVPIADVPIRSV